MIVKLRIFLLILSLWTHAWGGVHFYARGFDGNLGVVRWPKQQLQVEINASSSDSLTNDQVTRELQFAMDQWQGVATSSVSFQQVITFTTPVSIEGEPDLRNHIFFSAEDFDSTIIALTFVTSDINTKEIVDADMRFNKGAYQFLTQEQGPSDPNNRRIVLRNVATHEFGHFLGFDHSPLKENEFDNFSIQESTMFPNFNDRQGTLEQDDISILSFTYPTTSNPYTGSITGTILNSEFGFSGNPGAHVVAWDYFRNPNTAISTISGITATGINLNGFYKIEGLPPGNYVVFIEPFPIQSDSGRVQLDLDFDFLKRAPLFKNSFLSLSRSFPTEFWHGPAESNLEVSTGFSDAVFVVIDESNQNAHVDFITNNIDTDLDLRNSNLDAESKIIYANGTSTTKLSLLLRDSFSNIIQADLSSRLELRLTTGSFSSTTTLTRVTPSFLNDGSFLYTADLYSSQLPANVTQLESLINLHLDGKNNPVLFTPLKVTFEKPDPVNTTVLYLPDPQKFEQDNLPQPKTDRFADGQTPATLRIIPKFSDGSLISVPITTDLTRTFLSTTPSESSLTTFPIVSIGGNHYQTTFTSELPGVFRPIITIDGVILGNQETIRFSGISKDRSDLQLNVNTIHIRHPLIDTTPTATLRIQPALRDGSSIQSTILSDRIIILLSDESGQLSTSYTASPITGPFVGESSTFYYESTIAAGLKVDQIFINVEIDSQQLSKTETLFIDVSDPTKTELRTRNNFLLRGSEQIATIEVLPRFSNNTLVDLDISQLIFLGTSLGSLFNNSGEETNDTLSVISPSYAGSGILTAGLRAADLTGNALITGRVESQGFQDILQNATVRVVPGNANLLSVTVNDTLISADAKSTTTMTVIPLFPDGKPIGENFPANSLTASISEGEFLRKTPFVGNPDLLILSPVGRERVTFHPNGDGSFELSIRSTGFSTMAEISLELDNVLSLITKTVVFSSAGNADPGQTIVEIENPFLIGNGTSSTTISVFPRAANGEPTLLPQTSSVQVIATKGVLIGTLVKNPDLSFSRELQSTVTSNRETSIISVFIDGIEMSPDQNISVNFLNLDVSTLAPEIGIPDQNIIDGFDSFILSLVIRNINNFTFLSCPSNIREEQTLCSLDLNQDGDVDFDDLNRFDFNQDGAIDVLDLEILERAYGNPAP